MMKNLFLIPARGGSKGIPLKNIKELNGKPLIFYTLDAVKQIADDEDICISTDSYKIKKVVEDYGIEVPFMRPKYLSKDESTTNDVILHALKHYEEAGKKYDVVTLLQPTSPLRAAKHILEAISLFTLKMDMVVSVKKSKSNPYYLFYEEDKNGWLQKTFKSHFINRQECPNVYEFNGAVYVINVLSLKDSSLRKFKKVKKYVMKDEYSIDIDSSFDWAIAEYIIQLKEERENL